MENLSDYEEIRENAREEYQSQKPIYCEAVGENVYFTAEGFNHIVFKKARLERDKSTQILRYKLLSLAYELIALATTYQEYEKTISSLEVKSYKTREFRNRLVEYWGIIAILKNRKIKVILRRIDGAKIHFWSVIPAWSTNTIRDIKLFNTMKGNPEED